MKHPLKDQRPQPNMGPARVTSQTDPTAYGKRSTSASAVHGAASVRDSIARHFDPTKDRDPRSYTGGKRRENGG